MTDIIIILLRQELEGAWGGTNKMRGRLILANLKHLACVLEILHFNNMTCAATEFWDEDDAVRMN